MEKYNKGSVTTIVLIVIIFILAGMVWYVGKNQKTTDPSVKTQTNVKGVEGNDYTPAGTVKPTTISSAQPSYCGLTVTNPVMNAKVHFPLIIQGKIDNSDANTNGCIWSMFEGQAGIVELYYKDGGTWHSLVSTPVNVEDWTSNKTTFYTILSFNNGGIGLPPETLMKLVFKAENPSGKPENQRTYEIPVVFEGNSVNVGI